MNKTVVTEIDMLKRSSPVECSFFNRS